MGGKWQSRMGRKVRFVTRPEAERETGGYEVNMRDRRCSADIRELVLFYEEQIISDKNYILELEEDQKQGIQKHPRDNISIIKSTYAHDFDDEMYIMKAKYSLGDDIDSFIPNFNKAVFFCRKHI